MIIDTNKVQALLNDKNVSYDRISEFTGMSKGAIYPYRTGKRNISAMSIEVAWKLQELYERVNQEDTTTDVTIKGLKKAVGEFNNWDDQARIYFDKGELEVWTNVYPSNDDSWDEYHDKNIVEVIGKKGVSANDNNYLSMRELKNICINKLK